MSWEDHNLQATDIAKTSWNFVGRIVYCGLSVFYVRHAAGEDAEAKLV